MSRLLAFLVLLIVGSPDLAAEGRAWRVDGSTHGTDAAFASFPLVLHSAEYDAGVLTLHIGLRNGSRQAATAPLPMDPDAFFLADDASGARRPCVAMDESWRVKSGRVLLPQEAVVALVRFQVDHSWIDRDLVFVSGSHAPFRFRLSRLASFVPPDLTPLEGKVFQIDETLPPLGSGNRDISMRVGQMRWAEGRITLELVFTNIARFAFNATQSPKGADAHMLSADGHVLSLLDVRGNIVERIAPDGVWQPGQEVRGMIVFTTPDPHAAHRLWFLFPGYSPLPLMLDTEKQVLRVEEARRQTPGLTPARLLSTMEQTLFDSVTRFWAGVSADIQAGRVETALKFFEVDSMPELLKGIDKIAFESLTITPSASQRLELEQGLLRMVALDLRFRLKGQRGTNAFFTPMLCSMAGKSDGTWRVKALTFTHTPPFWTRGFTQIVRTPRFQVIHKDVAGDGAQAAQTAQALEKAYDRLLQAGLPMSASYVAFHCSSRGDFQILSGADPAFAGGAAPGLTLAEQGRVNMYNLAIYANDSTYGERYSLRDVQADRQTMLQHELVHLALGEWTREWTPSWLVEGAAVYYSGEKMKEGLAMIDNAMRGGLSLRKLSADGRRRPDNRDAAGLYLKYVFSAHVVEWIARHHGEPKLLAIYTDFGREFPSEWGSGDALDYSDESGAAKTARRLQITELMIQKHLGMTLDQLEGEVWQWLRGEIARVRR